MTVKSEKFHLKSLFIDTYILQYITDCQIVLNNLPSL